jgi:glycine/D-amino acid oxidase-like deaminating enzyme
VVGGGIAGSLLALRLARRTDTRVLLATGGGARDATAGSGGLVRGFEPDPYNAWLARESLAELHADARLRSMAEYQETGSVYLARTPPAEHELSALRTRLPGSARLLVPDEVASRFGITGAPAGSVAVHETRAGHINPDYLRRQVLSMLPKSGVQVTEAPVQRLWPTTDAGGPAGVTLDGRPVPADIVVLATGAWTEGLLAASGLPSGSFRIKVIQYGVYEVTGERPPAFVDEHSELYGRPVGPRRMLLGHPTDRWPSTPERAAGRFSTAEEGQVRALAARVLPRLRLVRVAHVTAATDGYARDGRLCLRATLPGVFTFAGGSGGAAKTALAATAAAAGQLLGIPNLLLPVPPANPVEGTRNEHPAADDLGAHLPGSGGDGRSRLVRQCPPVVQRHARHETGADLSAP